MKKEINLKQVFIILASLTFIITIGGAVYEHLTKIPIWSAAPPRSLSMFQGEYGMNSANFWQTIHPITLLLMIVSLGLNWKNPARKILLIILGIWIVIGAITGMYFVPELVRIITHPYSDTVIPELQQRAALWETLSLIRLATMFVMAYFLQLALLKSAKHYWISREI